jgi:cytoskeleton protein RodZ
MSDGAPEAAPAQGLTAGQLLRQAREAAGLHVASLAVGLKVPVRKLEALEEDRYDELPDAVFARALASSVCRTLKIDPQPVLQRLPQSGRPRLAQDNDGINAPFRAPGEGPAPGWKQQLTRPVGLIVLALLVGALLVAFLPRNWLDEVAASRNEPVMPPGTTTTVTSAPAEPRGTETTVVVSAPVRAPASAVAVAPAAVVTSTAAANAASAPAAAAAAGIVVFRTRANSWVQVTDATGASVLRKLMAPGESASASGTLPLTVTVGSAEATEVQVRGKPFNLGPVSRDNVARFEVK